MRNELATNDELLTISQTAKYLKLSDKTVRRLIKNKELVASIIGNRSWRIKMQDIESYLDSHTNGKREEK